MRFYTICLAGFKCFNVNEQNIYEQNLIIVRDEITQFKIKRTHPLKTFFIYTTINIIKF